MTVMPTIVRARQGTVWRPMRVADLVAVKSVSEQVHPLFPESPAVAAERLALYPAGCFLAQGGDGTVLGYGITHPGRLGRPPALDFLLGALPADADCLYMHDIALLAAARGTGLGDAVVALVRAQAVRDGFNRLALIAVNNSTGFWHRHGFRPWPVDPTGQAAFASYGAGAHYLACPS